MNAVTLLTFTLVWSQKVSRTPPQAPVPTHYYAPLILRFLVTLEWLVFQRRGDRESVALLPCTDIKWQE